MTPQYTVVAQNAEPNGRYLPTRFLLQYDNNMYRVLDLEQMRLFPPVERGMAASFGHWHAAPPEDPIHVDWDLIEEIKSIDDLVPMTALVEPGSHTRRPARLSIWDRPSKADLPQTKLNEIPTVTAIIDGYRQSLRVTPPAIRLLAATDSIDGHAIRLLRHYSATETHDRFASTWIWDFTRTASERGLADPSKFSDLSSWSKVALLDSEIPSHKARFESKAWDIVALSGREPVDHFPRDSFAGRVGAFLIAGVADGSRDVAQALIDTADEAPLFVGEPHSGHMWQAGTLHPDLDTLAKCLAILTKDGPKLPRRLESARCLLRTCSVTLATDQFDELNQLMRRSSSLTALVDYMKLSNRDRLAELARRVLGTLTRRAGGGPT